MSTRIRSVTGLRVWDSRGRPTVEAIVTLDGGAIGRAIAPAGASRGSHEAVDLRDGGTAFGGLDVRNALASVNGELARALTGMDAADQATIDDAIIALDGTTQKSRLGGNATIAVSMAVLHAAAAAAGKPLWQHLAGDADVTIPLPMIQIFGGGAHAGRRVDIQDFLVMCPTAANVAEALDRTAEIYRAGGALLAKAGLAAGVADEGGWWPAFATNEEALDWLVRAIEAAGYAPGDQAVIALDIAASEFGRNGRYRLGLEQRELDRDGMGEMLLRWIDHYPIRSIEDPFAEDDPEGFRRLTAAAGRRVQIVGDDFLVTNAARVEDAAKAGQVTCALIKPNQAGTITETLAALRAARANGLGAIISARSGETEDVTIAHLAIGWNAGQIKVGSITRGERTVKWNELLRIDTALGARSRFAGHAFGLAPVH